MKRQSLKQLVPIQIRRLRPELTGMARRLRWHRHVLPTVALDDLIGVSQCQLPDPILDDVCLPPYVGSTLDDFDTLRRIVWETQPSTVLELGTAHGNTVANICRLLPNTHVYTVNAPAAEQTGVLTTFDLTPDEIGRTYRDHGYDDRVTQIFANTLHLDLTGFFPEPAVDLAIIDACHDTEYVMNDFLKVEPFVRADGIVLLHDTHPSMRKHYAGSYRACMLLRRRGFDIRYLDGTAWGIWVKE